MRATPQSHTRGSIVQLLLMLWRDDKLLMHLAACRRTMFYLGLRETFNQKSALVSGLTLVAILLALGFIFYESRGAGGEKLPAEGPMAYFSDDDGRTFFTD